MVEGVGVAVVNKLDGFQIMVILSIAFSYHLVLKIYSAQNRKMGLRNYVRARIDGAIFDFEKTVSMIGESRDETGCIKIRFELLARTYLMDAYMDSLLKNGFKRYSDVELRSYCEETGGHIRNELIRRLLIFESNFPETIKALGESLYDTSSSIKRYERCAKKYIELNPVWWKFKLR